MQRAPCSLQRLAARKIKGRRTTSLGGLRLSSGTRVGDNFLLRTNSPFASKQKICVSGMPQTLGHTADSRLQKLLCALGVAPRVGLSRAMSTGEERIITIGDVSVHVQPPQSPELVPVGFGQAEDERQEVLEHLRWMLQKHALGQDMFLLGGPGPRRRRLAMHFCEVAGLEVEYIRITRDTTEADLKLRRDISGGTARWTEQAPVRAAIHGRVLILDGIEKAERNVLPTLNNLLENREMSLDDGRFLMSPARYASLQNEKQNTADLSMIVPVSPKFRVIALGLQVPRFVGFPLDPPLRSRFQARAVRALSPGLSSVSFQSCTKSVQVGLSKFAEIMCALEEGLESGFLHMTDEVVECAVQTHAKFPHAALPCILRRSYPYHLLPEPPSRVARHGARHDFEVLSDAFRRAGLAEVGEGEPGTAGGYFLRDVRVGGGGGYELGFACLGSGAADSHQVTVSSVLGTDTIHIPSPPIPDGDVAVHIAPDKVFQFNAELRMLLSDMTQDLALGHAVCLVGEKGCGKTSLVSELSRVLGYTRNTTTIHLYKDMGARDLLVRRMTNERGDSEWELSPLLKAAVNGGLVVLDGIHRVVALATPPTQKLNWLTPEAATLFSYHSFGVPASENEGQILRAVCPNASAHVIQSVLTVSKNLDSLRDDAALGGGVTLSLRQLIRITRRLSAYDDHLLPLLRRTCMTEFFPAQVRQAFDDTVLKALDKDAQRTSTQEESEPGSQALSIREIEGCIDIGGVRVPMRQPKNIALVPKVVFFDVDKHVRVLQQLLKDFVAGERHILLIGNQGVGKNKIADRLCGLLKMEREYVQLHRDTTVQALTVAPTLVDGVLTYQDSPLVKACKEGRIIMIDEADKAPLEVVCVLKGLLEDGHMILGDGRRLESVEPAPSLPADVIPIHPDFRAIVLANRPGYPFLGNDFFHECGDIFSCHLITNPDRDSELELLRQYGGHVPSHILHKLTDVFTELREAVASGRLAYPYSTRELVNIVRHLDQFPTDALHSVTDNVIAFDKHHKSAIQIVREIFTRHGIPLVLAHSSARGARGLARPSPLPPAKLLYQWCPRGPSFTTAFKRNVLKTRQYELVLEPAGRTHGIVNERLTGYSEKLVMWTVPEASGTPAGVVSLADGTIVLLVSPLCLHVHFPPDYTTCQRIDLSDYLSVLQVFASDLLFFSFKGLNKVALLSVSAGIGLLVQPGTKSITVFHSPELQKSAKSSRSSSGWQGLFGGDSAGRGGDMKGIVCREMRVGTCALIYSRRGAHVMLMDAAKGTLGVIELPKGTAVQSLFELSEREWMLQTTESHVVYGLVHRDEGEGGVSGVEWLTMSCESVPGGEAPSELFAAFQSESDLGPHAGGTCFAHTRTTYYTYTESPFAALDLESVRAGFVPIGPAGAIKIHGHVREQAQPMQFLPTIALPGARALVCLRLREGVEQGREGGQREGRGLVFECVDVATESLTRVAYAEEDDDVDAVLGACAVGASDMAVITSGENSDGATVSIWRFDQPRLRREEGEWRQERGLGAAGDQGGLRLTRSWDKGKKSPESKGPKHGKAPDGKRHAGGNTWQGGTGGTDTAGLGGRGGPYRLDLDDGNDIMQMSDEEKANISEEAREAARQMGQEELAKKLQEINMSPYEADLYERFYGPVSSEIDQLRVVLQSVEAKAHEREWVGLQSFGDLDDNRLVDGATGDRMIFRRRADVPPDPGAPQQKPKRIRFVLDVSGSMYRFNSYDRRLERCCQMAVMIMEALDGFDVKYQWSLAGHSGDGPVIDLVEYGKPPRDRAERLKVIKVMWSHAQYCQSGDCTLEAAQAAVESVLEAEADDYFVMLLSDANLRRYAIAPEELGEILTGDSKVKAYAIFIAGGKEAQRLSAALPFGRGVVCEDTKALPGVVKEIFAAASIM